MGIEKKNYNIILCNVPCHLDIHICETKLEVKEEENYDFDQQKNLWGG